MSIRRIAALTGVPRIAALGRYWLRGRSDFLVEGVSGTGKTSVCSDLTRRGYHAINADRERAYQGGPETGSASKAHRTSTTSGT